MSFPGRPGRQCREVGGKTRRAAKMNTIRDLHGDVEEFITAKDARRNGRRGPSSSRADGSFNGEAYGSVMYQNENLSVGSPTSSCRPPVEAGNGGRVPTTGKPPEKKGRLQAARPGRRGHLGLRRPDCSTTVPSRNGHTCKGTEPSTPPTPAAEYVFLNNTA